MGEGGVWHKEQDTEGSESELEENESSEVEEEVLEDENLMHNKIKLQKCENYPNAKISTFTVYFPKSN